MAQDREFDVVVFGATGFTGQRVLDELVRSGSSSPDRKYAAAGRSQAKVEAVLAGLKITGKVQVVVADVEDRSSLSAMAKSTRLVLNCVGPYRHWGEQVVRACVTAGTDYLDVSGEPEFIELMEHKYAEEARKNGCYIVSAAGFDSVPNDLGVLYTQRKFAPPAVPASVESFLSFTLGKEGAKIHYPTWESAVMGFGSAGELRALRKKVQKEKSAAPAEKKPPGPKLRRSPKPVWDSRVNAWSLPFPGADASIVRRSQSALAAKGEPTVQFTASFTVASRWTMLLFAFFGGLMAKLADYTWGRALLLTYPEIFSFGLVSRKGPSKAQLDTCGFQMLFIAHGFSSGEAAKKLAKPDRRIVTRITAPEPGYVATPIFIVQAALTLLAERTKLGPDVGPGGVFTTAALFGNTGYIERLKKAGVSFDDVSDERV